MLKHTCTLTSYLFQLIMLSIEFQNNQIILTHKLSFIASAEKPTRKNVWRLTCLTCLIPQAACFSEMTATFRRNFSNSTSEFESSVYLPVPTTYLEIGRWQVRVEIHMTCLASLPFSSAHPRSILCQPRQRQSSLNFPASFVSSRQFLWAFFSGIITDSLQHNFGRFFPLDRSGLWLFLIIGFNLGRIATSYNPINRF